ncbi:MAG: bifunctional 2-polyprenyl-6-hydroxyphenol methylase/3-demethylubiquinol 3-O-methyltransferase UbiG [Rhodobacteraceae bacterium]|nr:bifunctional 2-polyprenyl-6-hydroxyphenol methylase/3-demethylubiquinol 3-O-methyltransferase UbiG [Paracoccaceae bacterium]
MTTDPAEIEKFDALADEWWNPDGKFAPLHRLNPCRLDYINSQIEIEFERDIRRPKPFNGLSVLDIGCGGGLLTEPMARLGADATGIDASVRNIEVAKAHCSGSGLEITYLNADADCLNDGTNEYDAVLAMEVIEHVPDQAGFIELCAALLKPGGLLICSTISRTAKSFALAIVGAEYVLNWLPRGTHDWNRFVKPEELTKCAIAAGLTDIDCKGFVFDPLRWNWKISASDIDVNYVSAFTKQTGSG